jgi:hypothetical protein
MWFVVTVCIPNLGTLRHVANTHDPDLIIPTMHLKMLGERQRQRRRGCCRLHTWSCLAGSTLKDSSMNKSSGIKRVINWAGLEEDLGSCPELSDGLHF